jgi:hypothetical protein
MKMSPVWIKTTSQEYWDQMGQVPTRIHHGSSFLVGEECGTLNGEPTFQGYTEVNEQYFKTKMPVTATLFKILSTEVLCIKSETFEYGDLTDPLEAEAEWFGGVKYYREVVNH